MNDPNKRIDVNLSSLLSLKAELLRKQAEVNKAKTNHSISRAEPKKRSDKSAKVKPPPPEKRTEEYEDTEMLNKSRRVLEAKTKLYNRMSANGGGLNSDDSCLVMFNKKKQNESSSSCVRNDSSDDDEGDSGTPEAGEWVEYTDCLGRTRKCLKEDLEFFKKKDIDLSGAVAARQEHVTTSKWFEDTKGSMPPPPAPPASVQQKSFVDDDDSSSTVASKIDEMRANWDKQEGENINKDYVHYQDILFDEARTHGVGYYAFSSDESDRAKQQKELHEIRNKTLAAQKQREEEKKRRENIIAERVKAAKNRQRARLGLPPIEDEPSTPDQRLYDETEEQKRLAKEEKERAAKEFEEQLLAEERKKHIRPWDKGKSNNDDDDGEWEYKPEREPMSQAEWNEKKRAERNSEFAPVAEGKTKPNPFKYKPFSTPPPLPPEPPVKHFQQNSSTATPQLKKKPFTRRPIDDECPPPGVDPSEYGRIENELSDNDQDETSDSVRKRCEIAPPPTFEYYGPTSSKQRKLNAQPPQNIESSIAAGLKFLREQSDKGMPGTKMKWSSNVDY